MVTSIFLILISLALAYILGEVFNHIKIPRVVGQLGAGILLGATLPAVLLEPSSYDILEIFANLGAILLFYYVGLQINFKIFEKNLKRSLIISLLNTILPLALGYWYMRYVFHFDNFASLIVGITLAVSAQSIAVDLLEELKMLRSRLGTLIISSGTVDDIVELFMVSILLSSFGIALNRATSPFLWIDVLLFVGIIIIARLWIIPYALKFIDLDKSSTSHFTGSMLIVLLIAYLSEFLGVGALLGAMIAGLIVQQTLKSDIRLSVTEAHDISKSTHLIAFGFLIPLFFVWVGFQARVGLIGQNISLIIVFTSIAIVGTIIGTIMAVMLTN